MKKQNKAKKIVTKQSVIEPVVTTDNQITFGKETKETFYRYDIEIGKTAETKLLKYGLEHMVKDNDAIINYAINKILRDQVCPK